MKYLFYLALIVLVILVDFGLLVPLGLSWAVPSIFLLIVICISLEYGSLDFLWFAVLGGLWLDIFFALPLGSFSGAYLLLGLAAYLSYGRLLAESGWKYYLVFILLAQGFMLLWLWGFTNVLFRLHISDLALSGSQLLHQTWLLILGLLFSAFPVYGLVNVAARLGRKLLRKPQQF
jgi:hypothetical protein